MSFCPQGLSWGLCIKGLGYQDVLAGMDSRLQVMNGAVSWRLVVQARWRNGRGGGGEREKGIHISTVTLAGPLGRVLGWDHSLCRFFPARGWVLALAHSSLSFPQELPLRLGLRGAVEGKLHQAGTLFALYTVMPGTVPGTQ